MALARTIEKRSNVIVILNIIINYQMGKSDIVKTIFIYIGLLLLQISVVDKVTIINIV